MDTIAMATLNASTLLDHTAVDVQLATSVLIRTPAQVSHPRRSAGLTHKRTKRALRAPSGKGAPSKSG